MTLEKLCAMKILNCQPPFLFLNPGDSKLEGIQMSVSVCTVSVRIALLMNNKRESAKRTDNDLKNFCLLS